MDIDRKQKSGILPSINKYMHPRNPYKTPPSFKNLATLYPEFRQYCTYDFCGKVHLNFKNPEALCALTKGLLHHDFDLKVNIPTDRLVPTLPLRLNYLLWIEDIVNLKPMNSQCNHRMVGLDIGCGATCIYPLLGSRKFGWKFLATESDEFSCQCAIENVATNNFSDQIYLKNTTKTFDIVKEEEVARFLEKARAGGGECSKCMSKNRLDMPWKPKEKSFPNNEPTYLLDFTMCNPPFFSSEEEMDFKSKSKKDNRHEPRNAPTGSSNEKVIEGGEVAFISKMITDSIKHKETIRVFTSLIGSKKNVKIIQNLVKEVNPSHFIVSEFCQGRTMRWGIAWTFDSKVLLERVLSKKQMCDAKPLTIAVSRTSISQYSVDAVWKKVTDWLKILKIKPRLLKKNNYFVNATFKAYKETWLHQRRKKREEKRSRAKTISEQNVSNGHCEKRKRESLEIESVEVLMTEKKLRSDDDINSSLSSSNESVDSISLSSEVDNIKSGSEDELKNMLATCLVSEESGQSPRSSSGVLEHEEKIQKEAKHMECLLRCSVSIKQISGLISIDMLFLGGSRGKEAMNQVLQYIKNKLKSEAGQ